MLNVSLLCFLGRCTDNGDNRDDEFSKRLKNPVNRRFSTEYGRNNRQVVICARARIIWSTTATATATTTTTTRNIIGARNSESRRLRWEFDRSVHLVVIRIYTCIFIYIYIYTLYTHCIACTRFSGAENGYINDYINVCVVTKRGADRKQLLLRVVYY